MDLYFGKRYTRSSFITVVHLYRGSSLFNWCIVIIATYLFAIVARHLESGKHLSEYKLINQDLNATSFIRLKSEHVARGMVLQRIGMTLKSNNKCLYFILCATRRLGVSSDN